MRKIWFLITFVEENIQLRKRLIQKFSHGVKGILTSVHPWAQGILTKAIPGYKAFLLRPSMDPGLSYQVFAMVFAKDRAGVQGCVP